MSEKKDIKIKIGNTPQQLEYTPTVFSSNTPYLVWELPEDVVQSRFNIRFKSQESIAEFVVGETVSSRTYFQWPPGIPMTDLWLGLLHIEIVVSPNSSVGNPFEYTSGDAHNYAVYDTVAEDILNTTDVMYRWRSAFDENFGQQLQYNVQVAKDPLFDDPFIITDEFVNDTGSLWSTLQGIVEHNQSYFWKVRTYDGFDYSNWSITNGFRTVENAPPVVEILNVYVLNNDYGDVLIEFRTSDIDDEYMSVICTYTGGNQALVEKNCSMTNSLNYLPQGTHTVIWRSSRDEQKVQASDYKIYMRGWDRKNFGDQDFYGPFEMDNRRFGYEPGGFGAIEIEFPLSAYFVKRIQSDYETNHINPYMGYINAEKQDFESGDFPRCSGSSFKNHSMYGVGRNVLARDSLNLPWRTPWPNDYSNTGYDGPKYDKEYMFAAVEDDYNAPVFTEDPNVLGSDGYPLNLDFHRWTNFSFRKGYIKKYHVEYAYAEAHETYGYKNWTVVEEDGIYKRVEVNDGNRGEKTYNGRLIRLGVPTWIPIEEVLTPVQWDAFAYFILSGKIYNGKWQHIVGLHDERTWPTTGYSYTIGGTTRQEDSPRNTGVFVKKVYSDFETGDNHRHIGYIKLFDIFRPGQNWKMIGAVGPQASEYFSGYSPSENPGFATRPEPPYFGDKGIKLVGNLTKSEPLEPLKIIYLQQTWDAYNTVHWQATLGYSTKIHLQYTRYYDEENHGPWLDAMTKDVEYDEDLLLYLIQPLHWYAYLETLHAGMFENGVTYRFRVRLVDPISQTFSPYEYGTKFTIQHDAVNPVNIVGTTYEPWNKEVFIEFRLDDTQGDLYDIIGMDYTVDGRTFYPVELRDIRGQKTLLSSNVEGDSGEVTTHTIIWKSRPYGLEPGDDYRVRIFATYSDLVDGITKPIFSWWIYNNPTIRNAENQIAQLLGKTQAYVWNDETADWEEADEPTQVPGLIQFNNSKIEAIKAEPYPSGVYQYYQNGDETKPLIDPSGYWNWANTDIGGATRGEVISQYEEQNRDILEKTLPELYKKRNAAELETRKYLVKQGYYSNGYIDNDINNDVFRFRVESKPYNDTDAEDVFYASRWEVYYRVQIDFVDTYDSQEGEKPLRDIFYQEDGELIQAGQYRDESLVNEEGDIWKSTEVYDSVGLQLGDKTQDDKVWSGESEVDQGDPGGSSMVQGIYTESPETFDTKGFGTYILPKTLLPGERTDYYVNSTYPSVDDELPDGVVEFNYDYFWRIAAYNRVSGVSREVARPIITNVEIFTSSNYAKITFLASGAEELTNMRHVSKAHKVSGSWVDEPKNFYFSTTTKTPTWEEQATVSFPTDRPTDGNGDVIQDDRIIVVLVPEGIDRVRPWAVMGDNHQFYMWFSKKNFYGQYTVLQAMGKSSNTFGEYAQCFPYNVTDQLDSVVSSATAFYAPTVVERDGMYHMWFTATVGSNNYVYYTKTTKDFSDWDEVTLCNDLTGGYYPSAIYFDGYYHLWLAKPDGGLSKIFYFKSTSGTDWSPQNSGNAVYSLADNVNSPCVIRNGSYFVMYFTEYSGSDTKISSVISSNGVTWTDYQEEITDVGVSNPCVVVDRYMGNDVFRIYYNQVDNDKQIIKTAILNDRVWTLGDWGSLSGDWNNIESSIDGKEYYLFMSLSRNGLSGIPSSTDLRLRLNFYNTRGSRDYYVQSDWVDYEAEDFLETQVFPDSKFKYHEILKSINY